MKRTLSFLLCALIVFSSVFAALGADTGVIDLPYAVTEEMCKPSYWYDKGLLSADTRLLDYEAVKKVNQAVIDGNGTGVIDLFSIKEDYNATTAKSNLSVITLPKKDCYIDGVMIDKAAYFKSISDAILETGWDGECKTQFAVCTKGTTLMAYPTPDVIGYSDKDPDDEGANSGMCVNDPFAIRQKCDFGGETFYWGYAVNCTGWINSKSLAVCENRDEWINACRVVPGEKNFIVVTQDKILTEPSLLLPDTSNVKLTLGTVLKLADKADLPALIGERSTWNNYVVNLPTRDSNGRYKNQPALISQHCCVSVGFLEFTQANVLNVAFGCLGNRYGWAGMLDSMDCSLYIRNIYRCFGFEIPRNTTNQQNVPNTVLNFSGMNDEKRMEIIKTLPIGTPLYFSGHTMMYIGCDASTGYVISDLGTVIETIGELKARNVYSVVLNPLTVRRSNGFSWLTNLTCAVLFVPPQSIETASVKAVEDKDGNLTLSVTVNGKDLKEGVGYTAEKDGDTVKLTGINAFTGTAEVSIEKQGEDEPQIPIQIILKIMDIVKLVLDLCRKITGLM